MRNILLAPLWLAAAVAAAVIVPVFIFGMFVLGLIVWACGAHIKIKEGGKEIGYIRWFKYYPLMDHVMDKAVNRR